MSTVVINLSESKDATEMNTDNMVHQRQFEEARRWIEEGIRKAVHMRDHPQSEHVHKTITILGTRGSGKTTFLLTLRQYYNKYDSNVVVLKIIDPTLIEEKGHIFLYIISLINDCVREHLESNERDPNHELIVTQKEWNKQLLKLAHGLPSMDGVGGNLTDADWQDPEYIMEKGLRAVASARDLSKLFQDYVNLALKILQKDAFLMAFDDIDIDFKKGWPVLETIRKYLLTSRVITLLSGDLRLFSLAIRKQHWANFGKGLLKNEGDVLGKHTYFNDLITEMEAQYMLKVIKPERRIHLTSLYEKVMQGSAEDSTIQIQIGGTTVGIKEYYRNVLNSFGINNEYQSEAFISFLLSLPLRTQIQFLSEFDSYYSGVQHINVVDAFLNDLLEKGVDINLLNTSPELLNVEILKLLLREKDLNELYQLQPVTSDQSLNSSLVSLSLLSSIRMQHNPYLIFDYLIKIGYTRNLLNTLGYLDEAESSNLTITPSIQGLCYQSGLYQNKVLRDIVGNMTAYLRGFLSNSNLWGGTIPILGLGNISKQSESAIQDRIDVVFRNASADQRIIGFIPLSISTYTTKNQSITCYSVYTLLASIGELVRKSQQEDIDRGLLELSEIRSYVMPEFRRKINEGGDSSQIITDGANTSLSNDSYLRRAFVSWVRSFGNISISPHLLGKISTRFFYALNGIENIEEDSNLGDAMHYRIVALLNAIIIEDSRENIRQYREFNINNTNLSSDILITNLQAANTKYEYLEFSRWLISCPLFLLYLNPDKKLINALRHFLTLSNEDVDNISNYTVYPLLSRVSIKGNKRIKQQERASRGNSFEEIVEILKQRGAPFSLFAPTSNRGELKDNNATIRNNYPDLFGEGRSASTNISRFRSFLRNTDKRW